MLWIDVLLAASAALILTAVFAATLRPRGPWIGTTLVFLIVFLAAWAGGIWVTPAGPRLWGVPWLPFLAVGLLTVLLLGGMATLVPPPRSQEEVLERTEEQARAFLAWRRFVSLALFLLLLMILLHYAGAGA